MLHRRLRNITQRSYPLWSWNLISWSPMQPRKTAMARPYSHNVGDELTRAPLLLSWVNTSHRISR